MKKSFRIAPSKKKNRKRSLPIAAAMHAADVGASPTGSSFYKMLLACPREFALSQLLNFALETKSLPLDIGWAFHHCLEKFYNAIRAHQLLSEPRPDDPEWLWGGAKAGMIATYDALNLIAPPSEYAEEHEALTRLADRYFDEYEMKDRWRIIAVEETLQYAGGFPYSARLDLIVEDYEREGMWIVEHKTARYITADLLDNYQMDLQILGHVWLMKNCVDLSQYPPFKGVIVNIESKEKITKFARIAACPSRHHLAAFERSIAQYQHLFDVMESLGWPQYWHCSGFSRGYTQCQFYSVCHGHPEMSVADWAAQQDPPFGFIRKEDKAA